jgi:lipopolysaccharide export system protein LptA
MSISVPRLRQWLAAAALLAIAVVAGMYLYARHRVQNALKQVPEKIGIEIQQSATGFKISKSEQGRTLFTIQASKAVQFKQGGRAELHDVTITLYGRDSSRFDRIYGDDFEYDQQSGDVKSKGQVQIDLQSNPRGVTSPDQAPPAELKNPIHLETSALIFNQKTGDACTKQKVEFSLPQASGSSLGVHYVSKTSTLTMDSQVNLVFSHPAGIVATAETATIMKDPHWVLLDHPHVKNGSQQGEADQATLFLRNDNTLDSVVAQGNVLLQTSGTAVAQARAERLQLNMTEQGSELKTAVFTGSVQADVGGAQPMEANAGQVDLEFGNQNVLKKVHSEDGVRLIQHQNPSSPNAQDLQVTAPIVDFFMSSGQRLDRAETAGSAQIAIRPAASGRDARTVITAGKFEARFDDRGQLSSVHGAPDARIVNTSPGQPERVSTSQFLDANFRAGQGIVSIDQQGNVAYVDGEHRAWAERAHYTPSDQVLVLTGSPRVIDASMTTTARLMRMNRATGEAFADDDVKSTYSDLKTQPNGALLASSSPIHVTAQHMTIHGSAAVAFYTGGVRLWQDANLVEAPSIEFDRNRRSVAAQGSPDRPVSTVLVQLDSSGKATPIAITSTSLTYADNERKAHFSGNVVAKGADLTITSNETDAFLQALGSGSSHADSPSGKLQKIVAQGQVVITQPDRRATGDRLIYTADDDKFVLTGGPPSIFDAEHGKITGVSLTFFRHDDRVLVEGSNLTPTVTQTRVAR